MQLQNFECQIAKAQIGRYVAGDALSDEALQQLEAHVAGCTGCRQNLAERRAVLQAMLAPAQEDSKPDSKPKGFDLAGFVKSRVSAKQPVEAAVRTNPKTTNFTKPALYSLALGVVLIGMSYLSKNLGPMLGPKAAEAAPKVQPESPKPAPVVSTPPPSHPSAPVGKAVSAVATQLKTNVPLPAAAPRTSHPATAAQIPHGHRRSANRIRVYAPEN